MTTSFNPAFLLSLLQTRGQFVRAEWERPLKLRAAFKGKHKVTKRTTATVRAGVEYDNIAKVKEKRDAGTLPAVNDGLPWGKWLSAPYLITHNDETYVRLYPVTGAVPSVEYSLDGKPVTADKVRALCLGSEFKEGPMPDCFTVKADNLRKFAGIATAA